MKKILSILSIMQNGKIHIPAVLSWVIVIASIVVMFNVSEDNLMAVGGSISALATAFGVAYAIVRNRNGQDKN